MGRLWDCTVGSVPRAGLLVALVWACTSPASPGEGLYVAAAEALGVEAHQGRPRVVNPILVSLDNPRLPGRVLREFQEREYEVFGDRGEEDPEKATYYFTVVRPLEENRYQLRVHVSMGSRFGSQDRGDTWWRVTGECTDTCVVVQVESVGNRSW